MANTIDELLKNGDKDPITGETITYFHRDKILPVADQDRDDWDSPETVANIATIRKASRIRLEDGRYFGIRYPLFVTEPDENGNVEIIDGECRWRSTEDGPEELKMLPCIVRTGGKKERRLDHTSSNGARKGLTLYQTAMSIHKDEKEYGLTSDEICAVHGISPASQLSKYRAILKLNDRQKQIVRSGSFQDVNLVYELKKLDDEALTKLEKRVSKGESIQQAIKALVPKDPKKPKEPQGPIKERPDEDDDINGEGAGQGGQDPLNPEVSDSESFVNLTIGIEAAKALAHLLDVPAELDPRALQEALSDAIKKMAPDEEAAA
ncbi:ParB/RepB/Spo0J family partition protein [Pseudomonas savastanoi]|uniref:ParB/RepB/Spo0J family partition protein n=1 Tax=Pseudomonas savastanoi TaxID=29438 RepID=UPI000E32CC5E|nr:KorB domain-containing protein [Pseudomonas savastanoi]